MPKLIFSYYPHFWATLSRRGDANIKFSNWIFNSVLPFYRAICFHSETNSRVKNQLSSLFFTLFPSQILIHSFPAICRFHVGQILIITFPRTLLIARIRYRNSPCVYTAIYCTPSGQDLCLSARLPRQLSLIPPLLPSRKKVFYFIVVGRQHKWHW